MIYYNRKINNASLIIVRCLYVNNIKKSNSCSIDEKDFDQIITGEECDIVCKAGDVIGYTGQYQFKGHENHRTCHIEVFTEEDPTEFLKGVCGDKDDVKNSKKYIKIKEGVELKKGIPCVLKKDDEVTVHEFSNIDSEQYCQISLHKQVRDVNRSDLTYQENVYKPKDLQALNKIFSATLKVDSTLNLVKKLPKQEGKKRRRVSFTFGSDSTKYWVKKTDIALTSKPSDKYILQDNFNVFAHTNKPIEEVKNDCLGHDYFIKESELKDSIHYMDDEKWFKIETGTAVRNEHNLLVSKNIEGFISSKDASIERISSYDWESFGFKVYNEEPDKFLYNQEAKLLEEQDCPKFLKDIWNLIDTNGDNDLSSQELRYAQRNGYIQEKLSKMVCYHQSEWGVDYGSLESEVKSFLGDKVTEEDKESILSSLKTKVEALDFCSSIKIPVVELKESPVVLYLDSLKKKPFRLGETSKDEGRYSMFWQDLIFLRKEFTRKRSQVPLIDVSWRKFKDNRFYYFHPIAFVEQMKRCSLYVCFIDRIYFYEVYSTKFEKITDDLKKSFEIIFEGIEKYVTQKGQPFTKKQIAYILATIKHETKVYKPVVESYWCSEEARKKYYEEMYDPVLGKNESRRRAALKYGNTAKGDGVRYAGKGYVQITWKNNYKKAMDKFEVNFVDNPELALVPKNAIDITLYGFDIGMFTGKSIHDYIGEVQCDYLNARRVINGQDQAKRIKEYACKFEKCLIVK
ncbi:hypothetical protein K5X82_08850 [Halosquirtibacter xylanolyticus]|uniref:hypothetical protein n=1 Tax=Halosquirtibacter xylanolyticus TaxID=3374599 RepID=UPI003747FDCA|nr:hypothetical protein K5X82_08850 [Prolixibacteraceae bacterium]